MARMHGKDVRVYLGGRDASGDLVAVNLTPTVEAHDVTAFGAEWRSSDPGLFMWEGSLEGFYDPATGGIGEQLRNLGNNTAGIGVISVYDNDAGAVGDLGQLGSEALFTSRGLPITVADMIKVSGALKGNGRMAPIGRLLHALAQRSTSSQGTSLDNAASSANGGRANLHVTDIDGAAAITVQHSADNSSWADLVTFTPSAAGGFTSTVTGTVNRYLRADWAPGTDVTFVLGFGRF